jgi:Zn-dependent M28 family amino/carboxypeptidase
MVNTAYEIQNECERLVRVDPGERKLECEVWHQQGSGTHRFDMMGKRLYKTYANLTNIVIRVSDGTTEGKTHAVLVSAHLDSTLPSPGAADDALSIGVMLDIIRVLTHTPGWTPSHAIIFLFNHGEESLQDASHLFSTQHPIAHTIRAFINLEAAGNQGAELLFQATSEEMIRAYSKVPRPFGTVIANEVFSSGVLLSDTDFRQFEQYLNVPGLDMAIIGNSYIYHTRQDIVDNIQPGVAQGMAENVIAILRYLSSDASPLPSLTAGYTRPTTVFFSDFGRFIQYQFSTALLMYGTLFSLSVSLAWFVHRERVPGSRSGSRSPAGASASGFWMTQWNGVRALLFAFGGALICANGLAVIMHRVVGRNMSWFAVEHSALLLYGPAALTGMLISQTVLVPGVVGMEKERNVLTALLLMQSGGALAVQLIGLGSAYFLFINAVPLFVALSLDALLSRGSGVVSLWTYALGMLMPLFTGAKMACIVFDVFVPLTGRVGADAPADHIIASIVTVVLSLTGLLVTPFVHRFSRSVRVNAITVLIITTFAAAAVFALRSPFDEQHQRRLFVLSSDNITSHERHLHLGAADGAPGFEQLVDDIAANFGVVGTQAIQEDMHDWNGDWDILYPFSAVSKILFLFIEIWRFAFAFRPLIQKMYCVL